MKVIIKGIILELDLIYKIERNYYVVNLTMINGIVEAILLCDEKFINGDSKDYPDHAEMEMEFNRLLNFIEEHSSKSKLPYPIFK